MKCRELIVNCHQYFPEELYSLFTDNSNELAAIVERSAGKSKAMRTQTLIQNASRCQQDNHKFVRAWKKWKKALHDLCKLYIYKQQLISSDLRVFSLTIIICNLHKVGASKQAAFMSNNFLWDTSYVWVIWWELTDSRIY